MRLVYDFLNVYLYFAILIVPWGKLFFFLVDKAYVKIIRSYSGKRIGGLTQCFLVNEKLLPKLVLLTWFNGGLVIHLRSFQNMPDILQSEPINNLFSGG